MAAVFHFPPTQLWKMTAADINYWHEQARRIGNDAQT
ncbi:GpE family phage tail protein [Parasphingorhabdus sp.]